LASLPILDSGGVGWRSRDENVTDHIASPLVL
jgi:hypothetical protein